MADIPSQAGNLAVVTGANSGIVRHTACRRLHPRLTRVRRIAHRCLREQGAHLRCEGEERLCAGIRLHLESSVLADEFEFGFMESVEAQFEEVLVTEAEGAGE